MLYGRTTVAEHDHQRPGPGSRTVRPGNRRRSRATTPRAATAAGGRGGRRATRRARPCRRRSASCCGTGTRAGAGSGRRRSTRRRRGARPTRRGGPTRWTAPSVGVAGRRCARVSEWARRAPGAVTDMWSGCQEQTVAPASAGHRDRRHQDRRDEAIATSSGRAPAPSVSVSAPSDDSQTWFSQRPHRRNVRSDARDGHPDLDQLNPFEHRAQRIFPASQVVTRRVSPRFLSAGTAESLSKSREVSAGIRGRDQVRMKTVDEQVEADVEQDRTGEVRRSGRPRNPTRARAATVPAGRTPRRGRRRRGPRRRSGPTRRSPTAASCDAAAPAAAPPGTAAPRRPGRRSPRRGRAARPRCRAPARGSSRRPGPASRSGWSGSRIGRRIALAGSERPMPAASQPADAGPAQHPVGPDEAEVGARASPDPCSSRDQHERADDPDALQDERGDERRDLLAPGRPGRGGERRGEQRQEDAGEPREQDVGQAPGDRGPAPGVREAGRPGPSTGRYPRRPRGHGRAAKGRTHGGRKGAVPDRSGVNR